MRTQDLRRLTLKDNCITNMSPNIGHMHKLTELYLQRNDVSIWSLYKHAARSAGGHVLTLPCQFSRTAVAYALMQYDHSGVGVHALCSGPCVLSLHCVLLVATLVHPYPRPHSLSLPCLQLSMRQEPCGCDYSQTCGRGQMVDML